MTFKNPKGGAVISSIVAIVVTVVVVVLTGPIGLGILAGANGLFCNVNVYWGCSNASSGGTTYTASINDPCSSAPNACGQTNTGFIVQAACPAGSGGGTTNGGGGSQNGDSGALGRSGSGGSQGGQQCGVCNATPPPDSACPTPTVTPQTGFYATPATVSSGGETTLHWSVSNATACSIQGDNGFTYSGATSGTIATGALARTTSFTLTCSNGAAGPSTSASLKVIISPRYQEI